MDHDVQPSEPQEPRSGSTRVLADEPSFLQNILAKHNPCILLFLFVAILTIAGACTGIFYAVFEHFQTIVDLPTDDPIVPRRRQLPRESMQKIEVSRNVFCFLNHNPKSGSPYKFFIENVSVSYCSTLVYASLGIDRSGTKIRSKNPEVDFTARGIKRFVGLKKTRQDLTILLCIGSDDRDSEHFRKAVSSRETRLSFIGHTIAWLREQGFDGVVLYWRYPNLEVRTNFSRLLTSAKSMFAKSNLIACVVLPWHSSVRQKAYYVESIFNNFDYVFIDSHRTVDPYLFPVTTCQSPIRSVFRARHQGQPGLATILDDLSLESSGSLKRTALSISLGGVSFTVWKPMIHRVGMSATGPARPMDYTKKMGKVSYYEVMETLHKNSSWTKFYHRFSGCSVAFSAGTWIGFEDVKSISAKRPLVRKTSGIAVWDLEMDDFSGGLGPAWPLLTQVHSLVVD
ncbi:chitinase-3-like protein 2 [Ornithodoros turicata]|uniref:chitinase-3-like protein 2 n=1 Tax=Ornithodoros turicata TaxID=34597 RepID=UPI003139D47E